MAENRNLSRFVKVFHIDSEENLSYDLSATNRTDMTFIQSVPPLFCNDHQKGTEYKALESIPESSIYIQGPTNREKVQEDSRNNKNIIIFYFIFPRTKNMR
jgi:hypothetical protein